MKIQRVRGTRDFYPEDIALRNSIFNAWRRVSVRNGFTEYDGPLLEYLDLYRAKSGDEIVGQVFTINRGGEELAIRPEMTPTLARMINAKVQSLPRPVKWFTIGAFYRGERPQRGRLREFYQWNVDVVGSDEAVADAECIFVAIDLFRTMGLTPEDVSVRINDRRLLAAILDGLGIPRESHPQAFQLIDKAEKMEADKFADAWNEALGSTVRYDRMEPLLALDSWTSLRSCGHPVLSTDAVGRCVDELSRVYHVLDLFGVSDYCTYSMKVVRGLAYYTGVVFEGFDRKGELRAICGGGRYDNLLSVLGGPNLSGIGFGMGDVTLAELLTERGRQPEDTARLDVYVVVADESVREEAIRLVADLRGRGVAADFPYKKQAIGKQMSLAASRGARRCAILGSETRERKCIGVKDLATGQQVERSWQAFLENPLAPLD